MQITNVRRRNGHGAFEITALVGCKEFRQFQGYLSNLVVVPAKAVTEPATFTKTGAKHNTAKYVLVPVAVRRRYPLDDHDFSNLKCTVVENEDHVFLVYGIPKLPSGPVKRQGAPQVNSANSDP